MSTPETSTATPSRWGVFTKGAIGTVVLAVGGYLGAAMMQVISAPKDSVAYDLIQSMTGMLKPPPVAAPAPEPRVAATPQAAPAPAGEAKVAAIAPKPLPDDPGRMGLAPRPPAVSAPPSAPSAAPPPLAEAAPTSPQPAPEGSMLDRVRKAGELARQAQASTAALGASRILTLADRTKTPICGATYELEVSSVAANAGRVALRRTDSATAPVALAVGQQPTELGAGCRVVLLSTMEDLTTRRAQLRETAVR